MKTRQLIAVSAMVGAMLASRMGMAAKCLNDTDCTPGRCTMGECNSATYCANDNQCVNGAPCVGNRCTCANKSECGLNDDCVINDGGLGQCRGQSEPVGCTIACVSDIDCFRDADSEGAGSITTPGARICTYGIDDISGLCCPRAYAESEESFTCGVNGQEPADAREVIVPALVGLGILAAIRIRLRAGAKR